MSYPGTRPIGSTFHDEKYNVDIMVVYSWGCSGCFYEDPMKGCPLYAGECASCDRSDGKPVKFVEVKQ